MMTKAKPFFEVFPTLNISGTLHDKLEQAKVERVSATRQKDRLTVYLYSTRLIMKEDIWAAEKEIKAQLFPRGSMLVRIFERFELSAQYTPENLMEAYRESILAELLGYSHVEYNAFRTADISYPESGGIRLTLEDTIPNRGKEAELIRVLEKILVERCGLSTGVTVAYREAAPRKYTGDDELKIQMRVNEICLRAKLDTAYTENGGGQAGSGGKRVRGEGGTGQPEGNRRNTGDSRNGNVPAGGNGQNGTAAPDAGREQGNPSGGNASRGGTTRQAADGGFGHPGGFQRKGDFKRGEFRRNGDYGRTLKQSDDPDVLYGREFEDEAIPIEDIIGEMGEVTIRGKVLKTDSRQIRNERSIVMFDVTDFTDTMTVKLFVKNDFVKELLGGLKAGTFVKIKGVATLDKFDHELTLGSITGIRKIPNFTTVRRDMALHKRVELHCHTKMSDFDGVSEAKDIVRRAYNWGHRAIAITDHGVVQGFTDAFHVWQDLWKAEKGRCKENGETPDRQDFFKIIYGVEAYLVDDLKEIVTGDRGQGLDGDYVVFDIETTGFSPVNNRIIEIGAVKVSGGKVTDRFSDFVNPQVPIPFEIEKLTGIRDDMVTDAPLIEEVLPRFLRFCGGCVLVAHNAGFDMSFILENARRLGIPFTVYAGEKAENNEDAVVVKSADDGEGGDGTAGSASDEKTECTYVDTVGISRVLLPEQAKHTLDAVAKKLNISLENHHRAVDDAECTAWIFLKLIQMLNARGIHDLTQLNALGAASADLVKKLPTYHAIILAKNDLGRINLYKLVTESHLT